MIRYVVFRPGSSDMYEAFLRSITGVKSIERVKPAEYRSNLWDIWPNAKIFRVDCLNPAEIDHTDYFARNGLHIFLPIPEREVK